MLKYSYKQTFISVCIYIYKITNGDNRPARFCLFVLIKLFRLKKKGIKIIWLKIKFEQTKYSKSVYM